MNRRILVLVMALLLCALSACALAQTTTGTAYGIYSMEGEHADSLIRLTLTCEDGAGTAAQSGEAMGEDGAWAVADVTTGATLAGTPNYLLLAMQAFENAK